MVNYPNEWRTLSLKEIVGALSDGDWIEKQHIKSYGDYRIIQTGNIGIGKYIENYNYEKFMSNASFNFLHGNEVYEGDILISRLAEPAGRTIILPLVYEKMVTAVDVAIIRQNPELFSSVFLMYKMNSDYTLDIVSSNVSGTTHQRISRKNLEKLELTIPLLKEQEAIADTLSTFDEHIENLEKLIEKKKMIRDGAVEDLMSGKKRLSNYSDIWEYKSISSITKEVVTGGTPLTNIKEYWGGNIPWIASTEIHQKNINRETQNITELGLKNSSAKIAPENSVLIALAGQGKTRGTAAILRKKMSINQSLAALVCNNDNYYKFLFYSIELNYEQLRELSSGDGGRGGLNKKLIKNFKINIPKDIKEQQAIASILAAMDEEIDNIQKEKEKIKKIKQGAMDDLLTGRVRLV